MSVSRLALSLAIVATSGCALYHFYKPDVLQLDQSPRTPVPIDSVRLLAQEPAQTYKVIAMVSVSAVGIGASAKLERLSYELIKEAGKLGGTGVLIGPESLSESDETARLTGRVIVFDSLAPPVQSAVSKPRNTAAIIWTSATLTLLVASVVLPLITGAAWDSP